MKPPERQRLHFNGRLQNRADDKDQKTPSFLYCSLTVR